MSRLLRKFQAWVNGDPLPSQPWRANTRRAEYRYVYLRSQWWTEFRKGWWERHPNAPCADCGKLSPQGRHHDLHHLTYLRIAEELDSDVIPLCRDCHDRRHGR